MNEVREIVTRAVVAKGKKIFRVCEIVNPSNAAYSILGCWVINHVLVSGDNHYFN